MQILLMVVTIWVKPQASSDDDNMPDLIPHKVVTVSKNSNEASESLDNNDDMPNFIPHKVAIKSKKSFNSDIMTSMTRF